MNCKHILFFLTTLLFVTAGHVAAQQRPGMLGGTRPGAATEPVQVIYADSLVGLNQPGVVSRRLKGNVRLRHKGVLMYCDLAIQNSTANVVEAYGNVRLIQGDTVSVRGDTMFYYGNMRQANMRGRSVVLRDKRMTLSTKQLDYDLNSGIAHYPPRTPGLNGRIVDRENVLVSREGYYDTRTKQFTFLGAVKLVNDKNKTTLTADSLLYNSYTRIATFQGPTRIVNKDGVLVAKAGQYNTVTRISNFQQRATVNTPEYSLTGDTLQYDNLTELGLARGNVVMVAKDKNTVITGENARYNGKLGVSRVTGRAVVRSVQSGSTSDTLFMRADTLFSFDNKETKVRRLVGQRNVLVYRQDMQSKSDSLVYVMTPTDSTMYFYKKPIVWSQNSYQMESDSMTARMKNGRIEVLTLRGKAFVIAQDTLKNFNQIKGRTVVAFFQQVRDTLGLPGAPERQPAASQKGKTATANVAAKRNATSKTTSATQRPVGPLRIQERTQIDRVTVEGNGQSLYYAIDDKNKMIGLNRMDCSKMTLRFGPKNNVKTINTYGRPDASLTPPKEINDEKRKLAGFRWRIKEKPTRAMIVGTTDSTTIQAKPTLKRPAAPVAQKSGEPAKPNGAGTVLSGKN